MAIENGYCDLDELKAKLGRPSDDTEHDTQLEQAIEDASRMIDQITRSFFYTKDLSSGEKIDRFGRSENGIFIDVRTGCKMWFPAPIISVTSIEVGGVELTEDTDYYVYKNDMKIERESAWTSTRKGITFKGSIGYSSVPKDIREACLTIAEASSGIATKTIMDSEGDLEAIIRNTVPSWVYNQLLSRRTILNV